MKRYLRVGMAGLLGIFLSIGTGCSGTGFLISAGQELGPIVLETYLAREQAKAARKAGAKQRVPGQLRSAGATPYAPDLVGKR